MGGNSEVLSVYRHYWLPFLPDSYLHGDSLIGAACDS